jgi:chorismate mutase
VSKMPGRGSDDPEATGGQTAERLWAVRGAVQAERNDEASILDSTEELMRELIKRNELDPERMVSCIFTCTDDLDAQFPAVAARRLGLDRVPLICAREIDVRGAMERVIRVLVHYYAPADHSPTHAYLGAARELRSDLDSAQ